MTSDEDTRRAASEAARHAREAARHMREVAMAEARRLREEARRAREEARQEARRARDEGRERKEQLRAELNAWRSELQEEAPLGPAVEQDLALDGIQVVNIHQTAGRLTVRLCKEGERPRVSTSSSRSAPSLRVGRQGDRLTIDIEISLGRLFRRRQGAETVVLLAPGPRDVRIDAGYGRLDVSGIDAETLNLHVGAGDLAANSTAGRLEADVGAGKIAITGHRGTANCDIGTGDVLVDIAEIERGDLRISVGMGQAELRLPAGRQVRASATSGIGKGTVDYPQAGDDAPIRVVLNTGVGKALVRAREGAAAARPSPMREPPPGTAARRRQSEEVRVLQLLEQGRITSQEAAELLAALRGAPPPGTGNEGPAAAED